MSGPGTFNHRLALEMPVETPDGAGGVARSYATVTTLWASLTPVAARGDVSADRLGADVTHRILIRVGPEVTTRHRLRAGARVFRIVSFRDPDERGRFLEISAEERKD